MTAVLSKNTELVSPPTQRKIFEMLGFFLFSLFFTLLCLLIYLPRKTQTPWWVKIETQTPHCTYYFGPFDNPQEAQQLQPGYVEDLEKEGATGITVIVSQCNPPSLTICEEDE